MNTTRLLMIIFVASTLLRCSHTDQDTDEDYEEVGEEYDEYVEIPSEPPSEHVRPGRSGKDRKHYKKDRLVKTSNMRIKVEETNKTTDKLNSKIEESKAQLISMDLKRTTSGSSARVVVDVPTAKFISFVSFLRTLGEVLREDTSMNNESLRENRMKRNRKRIKNKVIELKKRYKKTKDKKERRRLRERIEQLAAEHQSSSDDSADVDDRIKYSRIEVFLQDYDSYHSRTHVARRTLVGVVGSSLSLPTLRDEATNLTGAGLAMRTSGREFGFNVLGYQGSDDLSGASMFIQFGTYASGGKRRALFSPFFGVLVGYAGIAEENFGLTGVSLGIEWYKNDFFFVDSFVRGIGYFGKKTGFATEPGLTLGLRF